MSWVKRIVDAYGKRSIGYKIRLSFLIMLIGIGVISTMTIASTHGFLEEYHVLSARITSANHLSPVAREDIGTEAYYLVVGRTTLQTTRLHDDWEMMDRSVRELLSQTSNGDSHTQLQIIQRTLGTLQKYCDQLTQQVKENAPLETRDVTLEQIREVSSLVAEQINEYIYLELKYMEQLDRQMQTQESILLLADLGVVIGVMALMVLAQLLIDRSIRVPINALVENTRRLSKGDFSAFVENSGTNEITVLNDSFNRMVEKLHGLMCELEQNTRTREQLELRLMQEQINPHFLYNTLEIIVWLAESGDKNKVIGVVQSLSHFFRVVLSQGRAVVTVREELACIESYLYIQQVRYSDILTYEIDAAESTMQYRIQKLSLQPLVENALYHGIKNKRGGGKIRVQVRLAGKRLQVKVMDNGKGMQEEELEKVRRAIRTGHAAGTGFGLSNVQKRVQLAYGEKYGITIFSQADCGTTVVMQIPAEQEDM